MMILESLENKQAAGLCAYALSRLGPETLQFENSTDAFNKLGELFNLKANTIKNFRDSFDPYTGSKRVGWHQHDKMRPKYLNDIFDTWRSNSDTEIVNAVKVLSGFTWLPDLGEVWDACEKGLMGEPDLAELVIPDEIANRIAKFLSQKRGYTIDHLAPSAMHITSKDKKQKSIISFAVLSKLKHLLPYLNAISAYKSAADLVIADLIVELPVSEQKTEQSVFNCIRSNTYDAVRLNAILKSKFGSTATVEQFLRALKDETWSGIKKSIFRSKKDVLNSVCLNKLNFENVKTGYIENLIEYFIESDDELPEMKSNGSMTSSETTSILPELDRNIIFFGAPGTGKSFAAKYYAGSNYIERVVFSADYQNSDFVGYLQPQADPKHGAKYEFESGPFIRALKIAFEKKDQPVVLLIEEINRGNAPAIFGELFQLLDRDASGASEYRVSVSPSVLNELSGIPELVSAQQIWLPSNLFIVGTMNSSDQGVFPLDTAFKRRFNFEYVPIDFDAHHANPDFIDPKINLGGEVVSWQIFGKAINETLLDALTAEDKLLGPFFLSPSELSKPNLDTLIVQKVCFYLWEDVLRHQDKNLIFAENLRSFSDFQNKFKARENIFADTVLNYISDLSKDNGGEIGEGETDSAD
jgi:hypothetical protein